MPPVGIDGVERGHANRIGIDAESVVKVFNLNPNDSIRLDDDGEEAVKVLKRFILGEIKDI